MSTLQVPFLDLKAQYQTIRLDIADAIQQVIDLISAKRHVA